MRDATLQLSSPTRLQFCDAQLSTGTSYCLLVSRAVINFNEGIQTFNYYCQSLKLEFMAFLFPFHSNIKAVCQKPCIKYKDKQRCHSRCQMCSRMPPSLYTACSNFRVSGSQFIQFETPLTRSNMTTKCVQLMWSTKIPSAFLAVY